MSDDKVAPIYSVWKNKKGGSLITIIGFSKLASSKENIIIVGSSKTNKTTILTPEQLLNNFEKVS